MLNMKYRNLHFPIVQEIIDIRPLGSKFPVNDWF